MKKAKQILLIHAQTSLTALQMPATSAHSSLSFTPQSDKPRYRTHPIQGFRASLVITSATQGVLSVAPAESHITRCCCNRTHISIRRLGASLGKGPVHVSSPNKTHKD